MVAAAMEQGGDMSESKKNSPEPGILLGSIRYFGTSRPDPNMCWQRFRPTSEKFIYPVLLGDAHPIRLPSPCIVISAMHDTHNDYYDIFFVSPERVGWRTLTWHHWIEGLFAAVK